MAYTITDHSFAGQTSLSKPSSLARFKDAVADKLQSAAAAVEQKAADAGGHSYGWQAADVLERSATYVRGLDADQIKDDIEDEIRARPGRSLAIAAGAGLVIGILLSRR